MIYSMTGFARLSAELPQAQVTLEIKSINHRYLEANFYLPDLFNSLELPLKELLRKKCERGRIDFRLQVKWLADASHQLPLDESLLAQLVKANQHIAQKLVHVAPVSPMDLLAWPGVINPNPKDLSTLQQAIVEMASEAIDKLVDMRATEGEVIAGLIRQRLERITDIIGEVRPQLPQLIELQKQRLLDKFQQAKLQLDQDRLAQEMVFFAQKCDVAEELDRLQTHVKAVHNLLAQGGRLGRKLDFLMQELNREANTLGSKILSADITHKVVELKVLIEEMREQIQNLE